MSRWAGIIMCVIMASTAAVPARAVTVKLGSIAPDGSPWDIALKRIAAEWRSISGGAVDIKIYPGGIVGNEPDMIRKMRIGQLQAAIFTGMGMSYITPEVFSLSLPYLVRNDDELDYLMKKTGPRFARLIEAKGFVVVVWSKAGWVNFFSKKPVIYPKDLKSQKLAVAEGDAEILQSWRVMGYSAVPLATNDLMTSLQNGMVEAFYSPPLVAASFQWFGIAKHMCGLKIAPMIGGLVISKKTWDAIPAATRQKLVASAKRIVDEMYAETQALERRAIVTMRKHGLQIHEVPPDAVGLWRKEARRGYDAYVGKTFSRELLRQLQDYLREYRKK
ncbi:MAG: TRAP transporter substrate-binding protein DctP [Spirochaetes bacterium]|nr:TRAP transporter substrate-binding protein DctP [Spirochaetota bacterium]